MSTFIVPNPFSNAAITFEASGKYEVAERLWDLVQKTNPANLDVDGVHDFNDFLDCYEVFFTIREILV